MTQDAERDVVAGEARPPWTFGLRLRAVRRGTQVHELSQVGSTLAVNGNRARFAYSRGIQEWYLSGPLGVEQGFELARKPLEGDGELVLCVSVTGNVVVSKAHGTNDAGDELAFHTSNGEMVARYRELYAYDANGKALPATMHVVPAGIELSVDDRAARYPLSVDPLIMAERKKLSASDAQDNDLFGGSVAISGDRAVVGAYYEDGAGSDRGAAYVFERDFGGADNWGERKKLSASDAEDKDDFGGSVAISGDLVIVGAFSEDGAGTDRGAAYVFERNLGGADNWGERKKLTASDAQDEDLFGGAVAISDDLIIVGAVYEDGASAYSDRGAAYVFERNLGGADNWGERKKLTAGDATSSYRFGGSVSISGDLVVVGVPGDGCPGGNACGSAYVFERGLGGADNWGERKKLIASDAEGGDSFGGSVATAGDLIAVGAASEDGAGSNRGAAYVFERDLGGADNWGERKKLTASDATDDDAFGNSVSVSGAVAIIGALFANSSGKTLGAAYVFERNLGGADNWGESKELIASDLGSRDWRFGASVANSGGLAIVGAYWAAGGGTARGAAYVFATQGADRACTANAQCASSFCVDGVCCDTACAGGTDDCMACSLAAGAAVDGACGPRTDGSVCNDGIACNGSDSCSAGACEQHALQCGGGNAGDPADAGAATDAGAGRGAGIASSGGTRSVGGGGSSVATDAARADSMQGSDSAGGCQIASHAQRARPPSGPWLLAFACMLLGASRLRRRRPDGLVPNPPSGGPRLSVCPITRAAAARILSSKSSVAIDSSRRRA